MSTQEWTPELVKEMVEVGGGYNAVAITHNAALAAEREKAKALVKSLQQIRYATAPIPQATEEQIANQPIEANNISCDALAKVKETNDQI